MGVGEHTDEHTNLVVTVFRSRLRAGVDEEYASLADEMERLARAMPGFVEIKTFTASDGERLSLVTFADRTAHDAWRDHPAHRAAQQQGRERLYASYAITVCAPGPTRRFDAATG